MRERRPDVLDAEDVDEELAELVDPRSDLRHRRGQPGVLAAPGHDRVLMAHRARARARRRDHRVVAARTRRRTCAPPEPPRRGSPMFTIGWAQQVWAAGKSTSTPSRRSSVTTALPVSGNIASLTHVTISATFIAASSPSRDADGARARSVARSWVTATRPRIASRSAGTRAQRTGLDEHVAQRRRLDRSGHHRPAGAVRDRLAQQPVLRAPADQVHGADALSREPLSGVQGARVRLRQALHDGAHEDRRRPGAPPGRARRTTARSGPACRRAAGNEGPARRTRARGRLTSAAAASSAVSSRGVPRRSQVRSVSLSSQVPMTLVRNLVRPPTPRSLVKFARRDSSVTTGWSSSTPTSPQVPQEM